MTVSPRQSDARRLSPMPQHREQHVNPQPGLIWPGPMPPETTPTRIMTVSPRQSDARRLSPVPLVYWYYNELPDSGHLSVPQLGRHLQHRSKSFLEDEPKVPRAPMFSHSEERFAGMSKAEVESWRAFVEKRNRKKRQAQSRTASSPSRNT